MESIARVISSMGNLEKTESLKLEISNGENQTTNQPLLQLVQNSTNLDSFVLNFFRLFINHWLALVEFVSLKVIFI